MSKLKLSSKFFHHPTAQSSLSVHRFCSRNAKTVAFSLVSILHPCKGCILLQNVECQSAWTSKITNDGLTRSGTGCFKLYPYGNSGRQRVKKEVHELSHNRCYRDRTCDPVSSSSSALWLSSLSCSRSLCRVVVYSPSTSSSLASSGGSRSVVTSSPSSPSVP